MDEQYWDGPVADTILNVLRAPFPMILQLEPTFQIIEKTNETLGSQYAGHRNIIMVNIADNEKNQEANAKQKEDRWTRGQMVFSLNAKDIPSLLTLWGAYANPITEAIRISDRDRIADYYAANENLAARVHLKEEMDLEIIMHQDFEEVKITENTASFLKEQIRYLSGRAHDVKQGIVVYTYPYEGDSTVTEASLNAKRDEVTGKLIQSGKGAPMTIEKRLPPSYKQVPYNGHYAVEGRGLWRMKDPLQGGTFVSFTVVDEEKQRVITVDGYVFCPQFDKKPLLLEMEAIIHSLTF